MMYLLHKILIPVLILSTSTQLPGVQGTLRRVCYYTNWSQYRPGLGRFTPQDIDPTLCSHVIYTFAKLTGNQLKAYEWNDESTPWSMGMYEQFNGLKQQHPSMKTLLAVGGWNLASGPFTLMVSTAQSRAEFAHSAVDFLRKWNFDGLDMDWEYPANRGSPSYDRNHFTEMLSELHSKFEQDAAATGRPRLLLTAAVGAGKDKIDTAYDIPQIMQYLDFINLMAYDLHGSWDTYTGHHTALYPRAVEQGDERHLNVDFAARYWVQKGASPSKMNIGLATYGRSFTLVDPAQNRMGDPAIGAGTPGQETREAGFLAYYEICQMLNSGGQVHDDREQHVHYVTLGKQWVGGEDQTTLAEKLAFRVSCVSGLMYNAATKTCDDPQNVQCANNNHPISGILQTQPSPVTTQPPPTTQPPTPAHAYDTTTAPKVNPGESPSSFCSTKSDGKYRDPTDCNRYIECDSSIGFAVTCSTGMVFNEAMHSCQYPYNTPECADYHDANIQDGI